MNRDQILAHLAPQAADILRIEVFSEHTSMDNTPSWTSLRHVQLLGCIERTFGLEIADQDAFRLRDAARILDYLETRSSGAGL
jgi:acyl carrier protein